MFRTILNIPFFFRQTRFMFHRFTVWIHAFAFVCVWSPFTYMFEANFHACDHSYTKFTGSFFFCSNERREMCFCSIVFQCYIALMKGIGMFFFLGFYKASNFCYVLTITGILCTASLHFGSFLAHMLLLSRLNVVK